MRRRSSLTLAGALAALVLAAAAPTLATDVEAEVERILATPGARPGAQVEQLAALGAPAVPVLIGKLRGYAHPMLIVESLGRIGDPRATQPLLDLLAELRPFVAEDTELEAQRAIVLAALREIGDPRAEALLARILAGPGALGTRLAVAAALARIGSAPTRTRARDFILGLERDVRAGRKGLAVRPGDLDQALFEVGTAESRARLVERLLHSPRPDQQLGLVRLLARRPGPAAVAALMAYCESDRGEPTVRLEAARALAGLGQPFPRDRLVDALLRLRDRIPKALRPDLDELLGRL